MLKTLHSTNELVVREMSVVEGSVSTEKYILYILIHVRTYVHTGWAKMSKKAVVYY